jgi:cell division transport system permease protein
MRRLLYLIRKSAGNILKRPLSGVTSLLLLLLLFLMFDLVWISALSVNKYLNRLLSKVDMEVFIENSVSDSVATVVFETVSELYGVGVAEFISKDDARERLYSMMGTDLLDGLEGNPLPRSINIAFERPFLNSDFLDQFERNLNRLQGISEIFYPKGQIRKIENLRSLTLKSVILLGLAISFAVVLNLLQSIRLSAKTREEELRQHRLTGAGKIFLSIPYILEGVFYALVASAIGWALIIYASGYITFRNVEIVFPTRLGIAYFFMVSCLIGMIGGYMGIRRSL